LAENRIEEEEIGMNKRWHLTAKEIAKIKALRLRRRSSTEIGRIMDLTRNTVTLTLKKLGMPTRLPDPEKEILALLRQNMDREDVAKQLRCPLRAVKRIGRKHGTKRKIARDPFRGKRAAVEAALRDPARQLSAKQIAREYKVVYRAVLRLAHRPEFYGKGKFIGGSPTPEKPAFESYEPQVREIAKRVETNVISSLSLRMTDPPTPVQVLNAEDALFLIDLIVRCEHAGRVPDDFIGFAEANVDRCLKTIPKQIWDALNHPDQQLIRHTLAIELLHATNTRRLMPEAVEMVN
jgi:hypothetical protein